MTPTAQPTDTDIGSGPALILEDTLRIPLDVQDLERFRRWARSPSFPETGRIDHLAGDVEVDMSPEDLYTHGVVKTAVIAGLHSLVVDGRHGQIFSDRTRVSSVAADLSAEPDVVVVLWESLESGKVRHVPAEGKGPGRFIELDGAPDLVVEILSDSSVGKDTQRLPRLYSRAGIPELWLIDARGEEPSLDIHRLEGDAYVRMEEGASGYVVSPLLGRGFRLRRQPAPHDSWYYSLQHID